VRVYFLEKVQHDPTSQVVATPQWSHELALNPDVFWFNMDQDAGAVRGFVQELRVALLEYSPGLSNGLRPGSSIRGWESHLSHPYATGCGLLTSWD